MSIEVPDFPPAGPSKRPAAPYAPLPKLSKPFLLDDAMTRSYKAQYANIYFLRLMQLRPVVAKVANERWQGVKGSPKLLERILKVQRSQLCYIVGTVYMEMPLKPNVLEDMGRDHWIAPPPPRPKFFSPEDVLHLEDESGRVTLVGERIRQEVTRPDGGLVTGVVMAALGMETASGDFEVIDLCYAGLPPVAALAGSEVERVPLQEKGKGKAKVEAEAMDVDKPVNGTGEREPVWVALVSGLSAGSADVPEDLKAQLLAEWLMGEGGVADDRLQGEKIARVIFAGNSLSAPVRNEDDKKPKRYGYDSSTYSSHPTTALDLLFTDMLSAGLPVHVLPGPEDPVGVTLPQQPFPRAMLRNAAMGAGAALRMETNPCWFEIGGKSFLGSGGQTLDDMYKYLPSDDRLSMARRTLEWRHVAPTAPDTLWCYPFSDKDPFIIERRPAVYFLGNQPEFRTAVVGESTSPTRIVLLPRFSETGLVVLLNLSSPTLEVRTVQIGAPEWEPERVRPSVSEQEALAQAEAERQRAAVVTSNLDLMMDGEGGGGEW